MSLPPDLLEMLLAFDDAGVRFLIIGGHAVSLHSRPRTTKDLDVWLDPNAENVDRACSALRTSGVPADVVDQLRTAQPDEIVWMGRVPARVDFLQAVPGLTFEPCWKRRVVVDLGGVPAPFLSREDLLVNKRTVGLPQDLRDVKAIERTANSIKKRPRKRTQ